MESAILGAVVGAVATLLLTAAVLAVTGRRRSRADLEAMLAAAQRESDDLRHRLEELTGRGPAPLSREAGQRGPAYLEGLFADSGDARAPIQPQQAEFLITRAGEPDDVDRVDVPDRLVLSATLGEPLVKVAAFSHGVRRALSAESRNRIWFEMRREVRASRKRRRRLVKDYLRETRARERANEGLA